MAYNAAIPQPTDQLSQSQADILGNFQALNTVVLSNNGSVTFPNQAVAPTLPANQDGLYAIVPTAIAPFPTSALSELFVSKNIFGGGTSQIPLTLSILSTATPLSGASGWTYLPSGIIMQWGSGTVTVPQILTAVNFPVKFPNQCLNVQVTPTNTNNGVTTPVIYINTLGYTQTTFSVACYPGAAAGTPGFTYLAIGY